MQIKKSLRLLILLIIPFISFAQTDNATYAEKLGFPKGSKVIILHVDDAGMSVNSNQGAINSIEKGVATSTSIMMPCPWAASFAKYAAEKGYDAGLHLTLTSEWGNYRWGPLAGMKKCPDWLIRSGAYGTSQKMCWHMQVPMR